MAHDTSFLFDVLDDGQVSVGDSDRDEHAADWSTSPDEAVRPDAVVWPESTDDVSRVLAAASDRGVPVTPYAAGTGLEGNAVPVREGVSMDLTRMDAVRDVRPADRQVDVEPGVIGDAVDEAVAKHGLFFPPLPSSGAISTVGGMIATDASGMGTVKYGEVADWVLELEAVLADGTVITAGSKAAKTSAGYNLADLLVGSEGTLGVVTRATLELAGRPQQKRGGRAVFADLDDAASAIADVIRSGVDVAKLELMGPVAADVATDYVGSDLPASPMLFLEFHADHHVDAEVDFCRSVLDAHDPVSVDIGDGDDAADLWELRRKMAYAVDEYDPVLEPLHPGDVTVPISDLPEMVRFAKSRGRAADLQVPCFGHAGDGNLHYEILVDPDDPEMVARGEDVYAAIVERAIELGGTATGEHGVGRGKRAFLDAEHGVGVDVMRTVKDALDPAGILNPGKIFPDEASE
ncbi:MAG: FAD-binding oxidoreductase [Haloarculaceae archaeon]